MGVNKKDFKVLGNLALTFAIVIVLIACLYNEFYVNGNNESNIKRSISKLQNEDVENISIIRALEVDNKLVVLYNKEYENGAAEFTKNFLGKYKINSSLDAEVGKVGFYLTDLTNQDNQYFIVYGDGNDINLGKVEVGINDQVVSIDIPKEEFAEVINITPYKIEDRYSFTYKFYDEFGDEVEQY